MDINKINAQFFGADSVKFVAAAGYPVIRIFRVLRFKNAVVQYGVDYRIHASGELSYDHIYRTKKVQVDGLMASAGKKWLWKNGHDLNGHIRSLHDDCKIEGMI